MYIVQILNGFLSLALWIPFGIGGWVLGLASPHVPVAIREPGIVYSVKQAESLGLDAQQTYADILDTLHPRYVRLIAYWDRIEKQQGIYDFSEMDAFVAASEQHYVKLMLVVGQKVPAGTGLKKYRRLIVGAKSDMQDVDAASRVFHALGAEEEE